MLRISETFRDELIYTVKRNERATSIWYSINLKFFSLRIRIKKETDILFDISFNWKRSATFSNEPDFSFSSVTIRLESP